VQTGVRVRQHVNPLAKEHQIAHPPPDWAAVFKDPCLPLLVDVGCGYGRFALRYAFDTPCQNVLGMEIREPTVQRAMTCACPPVLAITRYDAVYEAAERPDLNACSLYSVHAPCAVCKALACTTKSVRLA
jgi:2-polyprenyl-3-methyl-5-hydroxy-6-metoxy-1,4-benzoquinol methylase